MSSLLLKTVTYFDAFENGKDWDKDILPVVKQTLRDDCVVVTSKGELPCQEYLERVRAHFEKGDRFELQMVERLPDAVRYHYHQIPAGGGDGNKRLHKHSTWYFRDDNMVYRVVYNWSDPVE